MGSQRTDDGGGTHRTGTAPGAALPAVAGGNEKRVRRDFWSKLRRNLARLPFAAELVAAYCCATDPATPPRARAILFGALAYFIVPVDMVPDFVAGLGFTDDMTVLLLAMATVRGHVTVAHRDMAREILAKLADETPA